MAPPGRRRPFRATSLLYLFASILVFVLVVSFPSSVSAAGSGVIGIDLGTEYIKAALVKPGIPLEIVLTKDARRKEAAAIAFKPTRDNNAAFPERFYGSDAVSLAPRFPDDVYANLKVLLGVPLATGIQGSDIGESRNIVEIYKERYPALKISDVPGSRGTVGFRNDRLGKEEGKDAFLVEELLAMQLQQIKANAEEMAGPHSNIRDAVITFPAFYTAEEKRSLELAAELAGLNVLSLISDGLAVGTHYATSRTFPSITDGKTPEYHVVFDMGAGCTTATVMKFQSRTVKDVGKFNKTVQEVHVLGTAWDKTLGGDALNHVIVNDMVDTLVESKLGEGVTAEQVKSHGKTMAKLWKESERLRHILSANTEMSVSIEGLFGEDIIFKYSLTRSKFEELAKTHAERVTAPLLEALSSAQLSLEEIDSIILHGGVIRTPFVQKQLEAACKEPSKLRTSVNADEAAVFGATFKGAGYSPSFRVKEIRTSDAAAYAVGMSWKAGEKDRYQKVFTPQSEVGIEKHLTLKNLEDFEFKFLQQYVRDGQSIEAPVLEATTTNLTTSVEKLKDEYKCAPANITTQFSVRLSPQDGLPEIVAGSVSCEVSEKKGVVDGVKDFLGFGSDKGDQQPLKDGESSPEPIDLDSTPSSADGAAADETASAAVSEELGKPKDVKTRIESIPVGFSTSQLGIPRPSAEEMRRIQGRLAAFDESDLARVKREETFNNLESFIYRSRDLINDQDFLKAIPKEGLAALEEKLSDADEWLYGAGISAGTQDIKSKLSGLKELVEPVLKRQKEHTLRPTKLQNLKQNLSSAKTFLEVIDAQLKAEKSLSSESATATAVEGESTPAPSPDFSSDDFASLDDSESSSTTSSPSSTPSSVASIFTKEELLSLANTFNDINNWLDSETKKQDGLSESEDPILTIAMLDAKARELDAALNTIMSKMSKQGFDNGGEKKAKRGKGGKGRNGKGGKDKKQEKKEKQDEEQKEEKNSPEEAKKGKEGHKEEL